MDRILDIISKWPPIGQGFFFLCVLGFIVGGAVSLMNGLIILFRGYPKSKGKIINGYRIDD